MNPGAALRATGLRARLARHWQLGWPARVGIVCVVAAGFGAASGLPWLGREVAAARARVAVLSRAVDRAAPAAAAPVADAAWSPARIDGLPTIAYRAQRITALLDLASRSALALRRVEVQTRTETKLAVERCVLRVPFKGSYAALRRFLAAAWADDPALAIDALQWRREPGSSEVQGELRISLYSRTGVDTDPPRAQAAGVRGVGS